MPEAAARDDSLQQWIDREAIPFSVAPDSDTLAEAVDRLVAGLDASVRLLGLGEARHGGEEILQLRNRMFQRLVEQHGFRAIAVESSFPRGWLVNEFVLGQHPARYEEVAEHGFSHGFGRLEANRELIEWMRGYNARVAPERRIQFHGFDSPTEMTSTDSPRRLLTRVLDYLDSIPESADRQRRGRIESLLGSDADWENPEASLDPGKAFGSSPPAVALRGEVEDLVTELCLREPERSTRGHDGRYAEALQSAKLARWLLSYHAGLARAAPDRIRRLLALRDLMMAENLAYVVSQECERGKVMAFAHNSHLQRGLAEWQWGPERMRWWPAGSHLHARLGKGYAVIGTGVGASEDNGICAAEPSTLEGLLLASPGPVRLIPTHRGSAAPAFLPNLSRRSSGKNPTFFPFTVQSLADFDWLLVLDNVTCWRGGPPLPP